MLTFAAGMVFYIAFWTNKHLHSPWGDIAPVPLAVLAVWLLMLHAEQERRRNR